VIKREKKVLTNPITNPKPVIISHKAINTLQYNYKPNGGCQKENFGNG
jgi:hypothetical protein